MPGNTCITCGTTNPAARALWLRGDGPLRRDPYPPTIATTTVDPDSVVQALRGAVAMQQGVDRHNRRHPEMPIEVRVGLHVVEPIRDEADYFGTPVNLAARLVAAAAPGQILASTDVRDELADWPAIPLDPLTLKGFEQPVMAYDLHLSR